MVRGSIAVAAKSSVWECRRGRKSGPMDVFVEGLRGGVMQADGPGGFAKATPRGHRISEGSIGWWHFNRSQ
jgi:hypothetical protein